MINFFQTEEAKNDKQIKSFFQSTTIQDNNNSKFNLTDISSFQYQNSNLYNQNNNIDINEQSYFSHSVKNKEESEKPTPNFVFLKKLKEESIQEYNENALIQCIKNDQEEFFDCKKWKINDFQIGRPLGRGRFGRVYLAKVKKTGLLVALKIIDKEMVRKEIEIHSKLDHPYLLKMYGYFWDEKRLYQILEYGVHGEMYDKLNSQPLRRFQEDHVSKFMKQAIEAFIYLHQQNIIHRDLKPENILIGHNGIKIADFNWSIHCPSNNRKTYCGTFQYICPEMAQRKTYSNKLDLWCLGVLCFELATGDSPFEARDIQELNIKYKNLKKHLSYPNYLSKQIKNLTIIKNDIGISFKS